MSVCLDAFHSFILRVIILKRNDILAHKSLWAISRGESMNYWHSNLVSSVFVIEMNLSVQHRKSRTVCNKRGWNQLNTDKTVCWFNPRKVYRYYLGHENFCKVLIAKLDEQFNFGAVLIISAVFEDKWIFKSDVWMTTCI